MSATQQAGGWWEYRLQAPNLATLSEALAAIRTAGLVGFTAGPNIMLGTLVAVDASNIVNPNFPLFRYGVGSAASSYTAPDGTTGTVPARGVVGVFYIALRATISPDALPVDPLALGLVWSDQAESAVVLGVWA